MSTWALASEKWRNFVTRFESELRELNAPLDQTWDDVAPHVCSLTHVRVFVEERSFEALIALVDAWDPNRANAVQDVWQRMSPEKQTLAWRYAEFFLNVVDNR